MADWPTIIREYGPLVWRTAYRLLNHDADCQDCFQQTFIAAVEWAQKDVIRHWPAVLRRLATARALEILRVRCRQRQRNSPLAGEYADHNGEAPADFAVRGELAERLREALAEIDPSQASVFCLVCLEGMSNQEVADELGATANHVGVMLHRARQAVRRKLSAFDPAAERGGTT